ncbi:MAG: ABC transporter substrate-binding protein [Armatimonadota bacterium]|nr:ABC transporter substrate-binding protein [Armatimonadota bacterium]MDR7439077.1 ABC transporter substrate-binding protein [Armatimonadota bacterium]MDR7562986.1 ABC transporter substrate-binding protein [Armatimonadota bacterium]MDR7600830.1 ABC transporter substrate-binding protein [Armatimonadota bacterium]
MKRWVGLAVLIVLLLIGSLPGYPQAAPVRIGLVLSFASQPVQSRGVEEGLRLALEEVGNRVAGRTFELYREDDEGSPTVGLSKTRRLVEERRVDFLVGTVWSHVALALVDYLRTRDVIWIIPVATTRLLMTPERATPRMFRLVDTSDQNSFPLGRWVVHKRGHRNLVAIGFDVAAGHDGIGAFEAGVRAAGGRVLRKIFVRVGTVDYAPFLTPANLEGADAVYAWFAGVDAIRFLKQYDAFGWKARLPLYGGRPMVDEAYVSEAGDSALGVIAITPYTPLLDTPESRRFVQAFQRRYGRLPFSYEESGYTTGKLILAGLQAVRGDTSRREELAQALRREAPKIITPAGPLRLDRYNQRIFDQYVVRVERREGQLLNVPIDRIGQVAQVDVWQWWRR